MTFSSPCSKLLQGEEKAIRQKVFHVKGWTSRWRQSRIQRLMGFLPIPSPCSRGVINAILGGMGTNCVKMAAFSVCSAQKLSNGVP